jgi:hypothetical protein
MYKSVYEFLQTKCSCGKYVIAVTYAIFQKVFVTYSTYPYCESSLQLSCRGRSRRFSNRVWAFFIAASGFLMACFKSAINISLSAMRCNICRVYGQLCYATLRFWQWYIAFGIVCFVDCVCHLVWEYRNKIKKKDIIEQCVFGRIGHH